MISVRETLRPANGSFTQPPTREPLTGLVAPGTYGQARFERSAILVAAVPKRGNLARADVIGMYEGLTSAEATPGSVSSGGTPA